jgi:hypothetical protein
MSFPPHILPTNFISPFFKYMYMIDYILQLWHMSEGCVCEKPTVSWQLWQRTGRVDQVLSTTHRLFHNTSVIWSINQNRKTMQRKGAQTCCTDMQSFCSPWQGIGLQSQWECVGHWGQPCGVEMEGGRKECGHGGSGLQNRALLAKFPRLRSTTHACLIG